MRGSGRTSKQMREAPQGATYIWCNDILQYPRELAKTLGREDLRIVGVSEACGNGLKGIAGAMVIVDHWCDELSPRTRQHLREKLSYLY